MYSTDMDATVFEPSIAALQTGVDTSVLLAAAKAGSEHAFVELCERSSRMLYRSIFRILKNHEDTEDVMQDCFMKAHRSLPHFDQRCAFSSWLVRHAQQGTVRPFGRLLR